jgi:Fe-S-cluster-containing hydrogenase component 2
VDCCPVDCIYEGRTKRYINPAECIDCGACLPECPVDAITTLDESDPAWVEDNAEFFALPLPGRAAPLGAPGGAYGTGPIGVDTPLVADWKKE